MIDIRRPLEGVPGLLLMAALIFFGAAVGIGVALVFTWIPMSDALANFLGGVVGAGLGAALAVLGAVYVQRRDMRGRVSHIINLANASLRELDQHLEFFESFLAQMTPVAEPRDDHLQIAGRLLDLIAADIKGVPNLAELPEELFEALAQLRVELPKFVHDAGNYLEMFELLRGPVALYDRLRLELKQRRAEVAGLLQGLRDL